MGETHDIQQEEEGELESQHGARKASGPACPPRGGGTGQQGPELTSAGNLLRAERAQGLSGLVLERGSGLC